MEKVFWKKMSQKKFEKNFMKKLFKKYFIKKNSLHPTIGNFDEI